MEYHKKVYIKSEADLPKEDGIYFTFRDKTIKFIHAFIGNQPERKYYDGLTFEAFWLKYIDSYLLPVESPIVTDEETKKQGKELIRFLSWYHKQINIEYKGKNKIIDEYLKTR